MRAAWVVFAVLAASPACRKPTVDGAFSDEHHDVVIFASWPSASAAELESAVASPIERAVVAIGQVDAIDTLIDAHGIEIKLSVHPGQKAGGIAAEVIAALQRIANQLPPGATSRVVQYPSSSSVMRFENHPGETPRTFEHSRVQRLRTCGPRAGTDVFLDPARLAAVALTVDDVVNVLAAQPDPRTARFPHNLRIDDIAQLREADLSTCQVIGAGTHFASMHSTWEGGLLRILLDAGWTPGKMLGGQLEVLVDVDGTADRAESLAAVARAIGSEPYINFALAIDDRGPPRRARIIFRPAWGADVRAAIRTAIASVKGTRVVELLEGERIEAILFGPDRTELIANARAALVSLASTDPNEYIGCDGCDQVSQVELASAETRSALPGMIGRGLLIDREGAAPLRIRLGQDDAEVSLDAIGALLVRTPTGEAVPLSRTSAVRLTSSPAVRLRYNGMPAVVIWRRPWHETSAETMSKLAAALPGAVIRTRTPELW
jgi:hypothetical protein